MQTHVELPVGNEVVTGELFTPKDSYTASMVFCHGWTSKNTKYLKLAEELSHKGIISLAINLRGHGDSKYSIEKYSRKDHLNDVLTALDFLKNKCADIPCILLGKSYGGYLSAIASSMKQIDCLILSQPALYPDAEFGSGNAALIRKNPNIFRSKTETIESNIALRSIHDYTNQLLIVESEYDEEVFDTPKLYIKASEQNINRTTAIVKGSDHPLTKPEWREEYFNKIIQWMENVKIVGKK